MSQTSKLHLREKWNKNNRKKLFHLPKYKMLILNVKYKPLFTK